MNNIDTELIEKSGVYLITNTVNNKKYIGSSINLYYRFHGHKSSLLLNKHRNIHLQRSFNINGINSFKIEVLEFCDVNKLVEKEQFYIDKMNPEYNIVRLVERNTPSEISKIKISNTLKKRYKKGMVNPANKAIDVYDLKGIFIKSYNSCVECARDLKISQHSISDVLSGKYNQNCGYIFTLKGQKPNLNFKAKKGTTIYVTDLSTNITTKYNSVSDAARKLNIKIVTLHNILKTFSIYKNYKFTKDVPV